MNLPPAVRLAALLALLSARHTAEAAEPLPRATPEEVGVSSAQLLEFVDALDTRIVSVHSVMVLRRGKVIAEGWWEPHDAQTPHVMWSVSKSFTSAAVGLAVEEGRLSLSDPVLKFFPDEAPADPSPNLKAMTVRDLLTMTCGHDREPPLGRGRGWVRSFLRHPVPHEPGTHFVYNSMGSFMLSAIVQKVTGETLRDYLVPRLFEPLGIDTPRWDTNPDGICVGGWGLFLKTEDMARFGQLLLRRGDWNGRQVLPRGYVEAATSKQVDNARGWIAMNPDWSAGYGYQFWMARHNAFRGDGLFGQYIVVVPDEELVVALTSRTMQMPAEVSLIWEELLPALHEDPLTANPDAADRLSERLSTLKDPAVGREVEPAQ